MARGLDEPEDCESERTVIISELQGGENDPDQLLDTEVTATAFRAHAYRHPTIGWIDDLRSMTRDDLFGHYRSHYVPGNATLVVAGAVDTEDVLRRAQKHFGGLAGTPPPIRRRPTEPLQIGERRVLGEREGTTAYLKFAWHAPAAEDADFFPMLVLDAALTGAKGLNLWSSFRGVPPQRRPFFAYGRQARARRRSRAIRRPGAFLYSVSDGDRGRAAVSLRSRRGKSSACGPRLTEDDCRARSGITRGSSSRPDSAPTSPTRSAISRPSLARDFEALASASWP